MAMRTHQNPFRARASEQQSDHQSFVRHFGAGMLDLLPETLWDRLLVLRSAPGGGKTSMMRMFTTESLRALHERRDDLTALTERMVGLRALDAGGPTRLGVLLNLERDYRSLLDLGDTREDSLRLFFRLLDARIVTAVLRAALASAGLPFPEGCGDVRFEIDEEVNGTAAAAERLGGVEGAALLEQARSTEREVLSPLDSLAPIEAARAGGAHALDSLRFLSGAFPVVAGRSFRAQPLVMLDDGHQLGAEQRSELLARLGERDLRVARWYSERFEALSSEEILRGGIPGRDFERLHIEAEARNPNHRGGVRRFRHERVMKEVADVRADRALMRLAEVDHPFMELLEFESEPLLDERAREVTGTLRARLDELAGGHARYQAWLELPSSVKGYELAVQLRELEILIESDRRRAQRELWESELGEQELERKSTSNTREAARLFLAREFKLPYYFGPDVIARLGSHNMEQFLALCGDLFEEMLAQLVLGRRARLDAAQQDKIVRRASEDLWGEAPRRAPHGRDVRRLLEAIAALSQKDTFRPTAPYPPGPNGTALTMDERARLLDHTEREALPGGERLFNAIASAAAHNLVEVELDYSVKNQRVMVIYVNRLLCPRFGLALARGNFRERRLEVMAQWMLEGRPGRQQPLELGSPEPLHL
jgi:hypothetical protein